VARTAVSMRPAADGGALWVLARQPRALLRIDLKRLRADAQVALPLDPTDFDLAPTPGQAVVTFGEQGSVGLLDLARGQCRVVELGSRLSLARFRSDGRLVLAGQLSERLLTILEARSGRVMVHLPLAVEPRNFCFKSDGGQLFLTGDGMDAVVVVYPYTTEVAETTLAGRAPGFLAECGSEDFDYLFVANPRTGEVTIVDIDTRKVIAVVAVGRGPGYILPTPDHQYALVLNRDSGDIAVIRLAAISARRDRSAPLFTMIPVGSQPVSAVVRHV
jgi:YVTN family beta-propeller protein